jgi:hypothetical protein
VKRTSLAHDAASRVTAYRMANGTRASYTYENANRVLCLANLGPGGVARHPPFGGLPDTHRLGLPDTRRLASGCQTTMSCLLKTKAWSGFRDDPEWQAKLKAIKKEVGLGL